MPKIHIFGGTGLLGTALVEVCTKLSLDCITYSSSKLADKQIDISDKDAFKNLPFPRKEDYVINLAAIAQPAIVFHNKNLAYKVNVLGNENIALWALGRIKAFFYMSSVEVFDGSKSTWKESDQVCPLNIYGSQKAESESFIKKNFHDRYIIGRTSWNISSNNVGRCLVDTMINSLKQDNARMAVDNIFTIASARETAINIIKALDSEFSGIVHLASPSPISRYEIAKIIIDNFDDKSISCKKCKFSDLKFSEPRSLNNVLDTSLSIRTINACYSDPVSIIINKVISLNKND